VKDPYEILGVARTAPLDDHSEGFNLILDQLGVYAGCALRPGGTSMPRITALDMVRSDHKNSRRSPEFLISWLNHTSHATAVYASCSALPPAHATLASRRLVRTLPGPDLHRLIAPAWPGAFSPRANFVIGRRCTPASHQLLWPLIPWSFKDDASKSGKVVLRQGFMRAHGECLGCSLSGKCSGQFDLGQDKRRRLLVRERPMT
jgi:hypothetical protein